jgi:hypothetical protein
MTDISGASDIVVVATGDQGPPGLRGNSVLTGMVLPDATIGMNGDMYLNTATMTIYGPKVANNWPGVGVILVGANGLPGLQGAPGTPGVPGTNGNTILHGTGAPTTAVGNNGDFYINTTAWLIYGPKSGGLWSGTGQNVLGPLSWTTPVAWAGPGTVYSVGPPASCVMNAGSSYVCLVNHTSGSVFNTDLLAGDWALLAQGSTSGISDAPSDGSVYGRWNAAWVRVGSLQGNAQNLILQAASPNTHSVVVTADALVVSDGVTRYNTITGISQTCDLTVAGSGGIDTGTVATATWYAVHVIYNPATVTVSSLASLSATAPTLPTGYTQFARIGWVRTTAAGGGAMLAGTQYGNKFQYFTQQVMVHGAAGVYGAAPNWVAVSVAPFIPPTASEIRVRSTMQYNGSSAYSNVLCGTNTLMTNSHGLNPCQIEQALGTVSGLWTIFEVTMQLEAPNIFWASSAAGGGLFCHGWIDNR